MSMAKAKNRSALTETLLATLPASVRFRPFLTNGLVLIIQPHSGQHLIQNKQRYSNQAWESKSTGCRYPVIVSKVTLGPVLWRSDS